MLDIDKKAAKIRPLVPRGTDAKFTGSEPAWIKQPGDYRVSALSRAFGWYNYHYARRDAKEMIVEHVLRKGNSADAKSLSAAAESDVNQTIGWLCRMSDCGLELTEQEAAQVKQHLESLLTTVRATKHSSRTVPLVPRANIQQHMRDKTQQCAAELEAQFDEFMANGCRDVNDVRPIDCIRSQMPPPQMIGVITDLWRGRLSEFKAVQAGKDKDLVEGYSNFSKVQLRHCVTYCEQVINDCGAYVQIKKVERRPRRVKPVTPERRAVKFKHLVEHKELRLKGLSAASLVDKTEAWIYDSKKRKLIHVVADEHAKVFTVKNNSVIGFSTAETQQKTLRRPADTLRELVAAGKPAARRLFKDLTTTPTSWNARGTEHLIILKAW